MSPRSKNKLCRGIELCLFTAWIKEKKTCSLCSRNMLWLSWAYCVYATVALKRHLYACLGKHKAVCGEEQISYQRAPFSHSLLRIEKRPMSPKDETKSDLLKLTY